MAYRRKSPAGRQVRHRGFIFVGVAAVIAVITLAILLESGFDWQTVTIGFGIAAFVFIIGAAFFAYDKYVI